MDNKGKLFVTLFAFAPIPKTNSYWLLHPDTRIYPQLNSCTMTDFWLRDNLYRDTTPVPIYKLSTTETTSRLLIKIVPRHT